MVTYWTPDNGETNAGLSLTWSIGNPSNQSDDQMTSIVTIVAVVMVSMVCCACCLVCAFKMFKASRRRRIYLDRTEFALLYNGRRPNRRVYSQFPGQLSPSLYLTETNFETFMPKKPFEPGIVEVGEAVCGICLEEYYPHSMLPGAEVRKLPCKHVFHDMCVVTWLGSHGGIPQCPMCKANPFAQLFEPPPQEQQSSVIDASQLQLQLNNEVSGSDEAFRLGDSSGNHSPALAASAVVASSS